MSTLAQLSAILPFIKPVVSISIVSGILSGILPGLALLIFLALLPASALCDAPSGSESIP